MNITPLESAQKLLERSEKILLVSGDKFTGDGLASLLALHLTLARGGKDVMSVSAAGVNDVYTFLPGSDQVRSDLVGEGDFVISLSTKDAKVDHLKYITKDDGVNIMISAKNGDFSPEDVSFTTNGGKYDVVVTLGAPSLEYLDHIFEDNSHIFTTTPVINVDTSVENDFYGKIDLVDPQKSSVSELVYDLISSAEFTEKHFDHDVATILMTGIVSATSNYLDKNTTPSSFARAADLTDKGARHQEIVEHVLMRKPYETLKSWARIFQSLELDTVHKVLWGRLTDNDCLNMDVKPEDVQDVADIILRFIDGADIVCLFIEGEHEIMAQVRTDARDVNMKEVAQKCGKNTKVAQYGFDLSVTGKMLYEVESETIRAVMSYQKERLGIGEDQEMKLADVRPAGEQKELFPSSKKSTHKRIAKAPEHIPFEVPGMKIKEEFSQEEQSPKQETKEIPQKRRGIPEFLKKKED